MIRNHHQSSTWLQHLRCLRQQFLQRVHLSVHLYAQGLKHLRHVLLLAVGSKERLHHLQQVVNHQKLLLTASLHDGSGNPIAISQFTIQAEDASQLLLSVSVHHVGSCLSTPLVHSHVQLSVETERETALGIVEMMRADTQVSQHTIHLFHTIVAEKVPQIAEVASHESEMLFHPFQLLSVIALQFQLEVLKGIHVLVETIQVPMLTQSADNLMAMAASAESDIHPYAVAITDIQTVHTFLKQDRNMIGKTSSPVAHFR